MATVNVWPRLGTTVTLASGYVITATGAAALLPLSDEIDGLLKRNALETYDPTSVNPNPSPIPVGEPFLTFTATSGLTNDRVLTMGTNVALDLTVPGLATLSATGGGGGSGLSVATMAALAATPGTVNGQVCTVLGFYANNDGGGGGFYWDAGSSTVVVTGMCVAATGGRWKRILAVPTFRNVKWFGAYGDLSHIDTAAIQACINSCLSGGYEVHFPAGQYRINATLKSGDIASSTYGGNGIEGIRFTGVNASGEQVGISELWWDDSGNPVPGNPIIGGSCMFWVAGVNFEFHCLLFRTFVNHSIYSFVECGPMSAAYFCSHNEFHGCTFYGPTADAYPTYAVFYGVTMGVAVFYEANKENFLFDNCTWQNCVNGIYIGSGQAINTRVRDCQMFYVRSDGKPFGNGIGNQSPSTTLYILETDFNYLETCIKLDGKCQISVVNGEQESCKKLVVCFDPQAGSASPMILDGFRMNPGKVNTASAGPYPNTPLGWPAANVNYIDVAHGGALIMRGCVALLGPVTTSLPWSIYYQSHAPVISQGNTFPNSYPWVPYFYSGTKAAGIFSNGDNCTDPAVPFGGEVLQLAPIFGGYNRAKTYTISGTSTSVTITWDHSELEANYYVETSEVSSTGTPTRGFYWVDTITATGCVLHASVAPGAGNSVSVTCTPRR